MINTVHMIGMTDMGQPIVPADGLCEHWSPGKSPTIQRRECWYCRWADFRKTTEITLQQSVCRCPEARVSVLQGCTNERMPHGEKGRRHD